MSKPKKATKTNSPSPASNSPRVSRYQASEEEHRQFAKDYPSELIITMSNAGPGKSTKEKENQNG